MKYYILSALLSICFNFIAWGQNEIQWVNPSFEGTAGPKLVPGGWESHSFEGQSPPDTHPCNCGGVKQVAAEGDTYLGLLVKEENVWESVGQATAQVLEVGYRYQFSVQACRSYRYLHLEASNGLLENHGRAVMLRLWGGTYLEPFTYLLAQTTSIEPRDWTTYDFAFTLEYPVNYLTFEAYFEPGTEEAYNGNVLIDALTPIQKVVYVPDTLSTGTATLSVQEDAYYAEAKQEEEVVSPQSASGDEDSPGRFSKKKRKQSSNSYASSGSYTGNGYEYINPKRRHAAEKRNRLNRRELMMVAQQELEAAKKPKAEEKDKPLIYDEESIIEYSKIRQAEALKQMPSNAEAIYVPQEIRDPLVEIGPSLLNYVFQVDKAIMQDLASQMDSSGIYTLIVAVNASQQGVRDKIAWDLEDTRKQMDIGEHLIKVEQYIGQNTYFKDWLWQAEGQRVMMRVVPRKEY
jgi:hypothetical protein